MVASSEAAIHLHSVKGEKNLIQVCGDRSRKYGLAAVPRVFEPAGNGTSGVILMVHTVHVIATEYLRIRPQLHAVLGLLATTAQSTATLGPAKMAAQAGEV